MLHECDTGRRFDQQPWRFVASYHFVVKRRPTWFEGTPEMRKFDSFSRFTVSASVIAIGAAFAAPAYAQTPVTPPNCAAIQNEAQRQACAQAAEQVDPLANSGEASTTAAGAGNADSTQSTRPSSGIVITTWGGCP